MINDLHLVQPEQERGACGLGEPQSMLDAPLLLFWKKVYKTDGCWFWIGARNHAGYGIFKYLGRFTR